ncbi:hypothetical protein OSSY52_09530 [Tepiditoga spiralis]|uniref:Rubrerythrin diiron-binding domain-containing protein n=1 Tax=Tepiditoga spiralis TaxID=2108365 RepID=A0A7G1G9Q7_9BACT|nr:ferritin family protein [Tepiditoga spiralis]BBE30812.1 hypothetical protein OSSY52_09530 [Tepiditoga spiralis]
MKGIVGILNYALSKEIEGRNFYKEKSEKVKTKELKEVFTDLGEMEASHVEFIKNLISNYEKNNSLDIEVPEEDDSIFFKREKIDTITGKAEDLALDLTVLKMGYLIEEDFMNFYKNASEKIEDLEAKNVFNMLSKWEKVHRDVLYNLYKQLSDEYWDDMGFTPLY